MFGINDVSATWLSIPATYATGFGFIFSYGRLMLAMSESRLLPRVLRVKWGSGDNGTPSLAFLIGSGVGFLVCIFVYFFPGIQKHLFNICILFAFGAYTSQFVGFINLRTRFADLPRLYHSPLGLFGAYLGTLIFTLASISVIAFQKDGFTAFIAVVIIAALNSVYYFCSAKHHQKFSRDELKTLFNAHVFKRKFSYSTNAQLRISTQCSCFCAVFQRRVKQRSTYSVLTFDLSASLRSILALTNYSRTSYLLFSLSCCLSSSGMCFQQEQAGESEEVSEEDL
jgi:hypothetical protein